ncbi:hypothetical protein AnigIFM63309_001363 [Aspergillus niger]|nr:hypothetical protein AnigIFM63309_001363 [Aspergillus niger]
MDTNRLLEIETRLFINNEYVSSTSDSKLTIHNPANDSIVTTEVQVANKRDVDSAVGAALTAFKTGPWRYFTGQERGACLLRLADLIDRHANRLLSLEALAMGVPASGMSFMMPLVSKYLRYYAGHADKIAGETYPAEDGLYKIITYEPLGVCASLASFNATFLYVALKLAPALAAGNTCVFKASEKSPLGALALGELVCKAGFPPGVINFVSGGVETGIALSEHMDVAHISFTGSLGAGRKVQEAAAKTNLKRCTLELGGKSPALIFSDADMDLALDWYATSRVYVHEEIAPSFLKALKQRFQDAKTKMGDPSSMHTLFGPLADKAQMERALRLIESGKNDAELICGGSRLGDTGCFIEPTLFYNPKANSKIYKEEVFGPVLVVKTFKTEEEAITMANDSLFGLSACIYTSDITRALRVSALLEAGTVGINKNFGPSVETPFGGVKTSGVGRESGKMGLMEYLESKTIHIR